jgi:DNA-binding beta-propeller fold protein YncE
MKRIFWAMALAIVAIAGAGMARAQTSNPAAPDATLRTITPTVTVVPLGRWPEGLAWDGAALWIAESGVQRIAKVDPAAGRVTETVRVGRLPVDMAAGADGTVYALVNTERAVFARKRGGPGAVLSGVAGCPEHLALSGTTLLVLTWPDCSSADSKVVAIDTATARSRTSPSLGKDAVAIAAAGDHAWVLHRDGTIDVVDSAALTKRATVTIGGTTLAMAASEGAIFVGGLDRPEGGAPLVARIDVASRAVTHRGTLPGAGRVVAIASAGRHIVVADELGALFALSADDLTPLARLGAPGLAGDGPRGMLVVGDRLYVTIHKGVGVNGSLLVIDGWRP